jgi:DinB superfamily
MPNADAHADLRTMGLLEQLTWHWDRQLRPGLDGLTDAELFWEPVDGCWSLVPRAEARTPMFGGAGELVAEIEFPEPVPAPVTTIAWRLGHMLVGVFGMRNAAHFGGPPIDYQTVVWPTTATSMLAAIDDAYGRWVNGVRGLGVDDLAKPVGPAEGQYAEHSYESLVLHIHREVIHHGAEVLLLRDLFRHGFAV